MKNNKLWILALFLVITLPQIDAVTINTGTSYLATDGNLTINFTATRYADQIIIGNDSIYFQDYRSLSSTNQNLTFNITEQNKFFPHTSLPYFSTSRIILSGLANSVTDSEIIIYSACQDLEDISTETHADPAYTCIEGLITISNLIIASGTNTLNLVYTQASTGGGSNGGTTYTNETNGTVTCTDWTFCWINKQSRECNGVQEERSCSIISEITNENKTCGFESNWGKCTDEVQTRNVYREVDEQCKVTEEIRPCEKTAFRTRWDNFIDIILHFLENIVDIFR